MDKKTTKNKICILLGLLILATGLAISGKIGRSTTFAKYKTIIDSNYHKQVRMAIGFLRFIIYQM